MKLYFDFSPGYYWKVSIAHTYFRITKGLWSGGSNYICILIFDRTLKDKEVCDQKKYFCENAYKRPRKWC